MWSFRASIWRRESGGWRAESRQDAHSAAPRFFRGFYSPSICVRYQVMMASPHP